MRGLFSTWLMPETTDARDLQAIIDDLAGTFGQQRFAAHLTVAEEVCRDEAEMARLIEEAAERIPRFAAVVESIESNDLHFRCLYARFSLPDPLVRFRSGLAARLGLDADAAFMPHVSLLYGVKDSPQKRFVQQELMSKLLGRRIGFDRVCLVASAKEIPVEDWVVRAAIPLACL